MKEQQKTQTSSTKNILQKIGNIASLIVDKFEVWVIMISTSGLAVLCIDLSTLQKRSRNYLLFLLLLWVRVMRQEKLVTFEWEHY
jgi:hypothetical protein